jgi:hypothetical protein
MLKPTLTIALIAALLTSLGCVSEEALHREKALEGWVSAHEAQRAGPEMPQTVKYVSSLGVGPIVNVTRRGTIATTRPAAALATYQFSVGGGINFFRHEVDRVVLFEIECFSAKHLKSTVHYLSWENGRWNEAFTGLEDEAPATKP